MMNEVFTTSCRRELNSPAAIWTLYVHWDIQSTIASGGAIELCFIIFGARYRYCELRIVFKQRRIRFQVSSISSGFCQFTLRCVACWCASDLDAGGLTSFLARSAQRSPGGERTLGPFAAGRTYAQAVQRVVQPTLAFPFQPPQSGELFAQFSIG